MPHRPAFLPPVDNPLVRALTMQCVRPLLHFHAGGIEVDTRPEDLALLRSFKKQRLLLLPNHPTHFDPLVMLELSNRLEEEFYFVAAREVFDLNHGLRGWLSQRIGVYSLIRGAVDRESITLTQKVLSEGKHWLVLFPEGESTLENDRVIPFEPGVASLALRVQEKLLDDAPSPDAAPPLHTLTIAMRSFYHPGIERPIAASLDRLEAALGLSKAGPFVSWDAARQRINRIGDTLLTLVEKSTLLPPRKGQPLDPRIIAIKDHLLAKMETFLQLKVSLDTPTLDRVRAVKNAMDRAALAYGDADNQLPSYEKRLLDHRRTTFAGFYTDVARIINFITLRGDYLNHASPERYAEVLLRLEQEILGRPWLTHPRTVRLRCGTPCDLRRKLQQCGTDKKKAGPALIHEWESEMNALLQAPLPAQEKTPS